VPVLPSAEKPGNRGKPRRRKLEAEARAYVLKHRVRLRTVRSAQCWRAGGEWAVACGMCCMWTMDGRAQGAVAFVALSGISLSLMVLGGQLATSRSLTPVISVHGSPRKKRTAQPQSLTHSPPSRRLLLKTSFEILAHLPAHDSLSAACGHAHAQFLLPLPPPPMLVLSPARGAATSDPRRPAPPASVPARAPTLP
jgi:hypothetical protein